jgi:hypothetical protein
MNKSKKKLRLNRETVRLMADKDLWNIIGGVTRVPTCNTADVNCTNITSCNVDTLPPRTC